MLIIPIYAKVSLKPRIKESNSLSKLLKKIKLAKAKKKERLISEKIKNKKPRKARLVIKKNTTSTQRPANQHKINIVNNLVPLVKGATSKINKNNKKIKKYPPFQGKSIYNQRS